MTENLFQILFSQLITNKDGKNFMEMSMELEVIAIIIKLKEILQNMSNFK